MLLNLAFSRARRLRTETRTVLRLAREPETGVVISSEADGFWSAIRRLPRRQAEVLALYYAEDLGTTEIAGILGVAEGTVRALLRQGRQSVRQQIHKDQEREGRHG